MTNWQTWHVTQLTPEAALAHERRAYNVQNNVTLGWTPYNYRVTYGAVSQWACHTKEEFERYCRQNKFSLDWSPWRDGIRYATLTRLEFTQE